MKLIDYTTCGNIDKDTRDQYMDGSEEFDYYQSIDMIQEQMPDLYEQLSLQYYNPRHGSTYITKQHLIITWSAIEYFISYTK